MLCPDNRLGDLDVLFHVFEEGAAEIADGGGQVGVLGNGAVFALFVEVVFVVFPDQKVVVLTTAEAIGHSGGVHRGTDNFVVHARRDSGATPHGRGGKTEQISGFVECAAA